VHGQADLLQVIGALNPGRRRTHLLHGGQQQTNEDRDDGNNDKQFD
jgi:hypothetical protein